MELCKNQFAISQSWGSDLTDSVINVPQEGLLRRRELGVLCWDCRPPGLLGGVEEGWARAWKQDGVGGWTPSVVCIRLYSGLLFREWRGKMHEDYPLTF